MSMFLKDWHIKMELTQDQSCEQNIRKRTGVQIILKHIKVVKDLREGVLDMILSIVIMCFIYYEGVK